MTRFAGRTVVVTGAGSGIGAATAVRLHAEGAAVVLVDRDPGAVRRVAADLAGGLAGDRILPLPVDVSDAAALGAAVSQVATWRAAVHGVVNAAGVLRWGGTCDTVEADWDLVLAVNLKGTWLVAKAFAPLMRDGGAIVNVASNMGVKGVAEQLAYSASKGGVIALSRSMAVDLGPRGIRVNCVNPGHIRTPMGDSAAERLGLRPDTISARYPLGRIGDADEVAATIAYLLSADAGFVTGAIVAVDGGNTAW